jgi:hypothetical protein
MKNLIIILLCIFAIACSPKKEKDPTPFITAQSGLTVDYQNNDAVPIQGWIICYSIDDAVVYDSVFLTKQGMNSFIITKSITRNVKFWRSGRKSRGIMLYNANLYSKVVYSNWSVGTIDFDEVQTTLK